MLSVGLMIYGFRRYQDLSREIDARTAAESEARMMARHYPLTGLPNRRFFEERLTDYLHATSATSQLACSYARSGRL
jgi:GGDEF domain-containing protein